MNKEIKILTISDTHGQALPEIDTSVNVIIHAGDLNSRGCSNYKKQFVDFKTMIDTMYNACDYALYTDGLEMNVEEIYISFGNHETFLDGSAMNHNNNKFSRVKVFNYINEMVDKFKEIGIDIIFAVSKQSDEFTYKDVHAIHGMYKADTVRYESKFEALGWVVLTPFTIPVNNPARWGNHWSKRTQDEFIETMEKGCKTLVTHSPPFGYLDTARPWRNSGMRVGDNLIRHVMDEVTHVDLIICGHIHESHGYIQTENGTDIYNVSMLDHDYEIKWGFTEIML